MRRVDAVVYMPKPKPKPKPKAKPKPKPKAIVKVVNKCQKEKLRKEDLAELCKDKGFYKGVKNKKTSSIFPDLSYHFSANYSTMLFLGNIGTYIPLALGPGGSFSLLGKMTREVDSNWEKSSFLLTQGLRLIYYMKTFWIDISVNQSMFGLKWLYGKEMILKFGFHTGLGFYDWEINFLSLKTKANNVEKHRLNGILLVLIWL